MGTVVDNIRPAPGGLQHRLHLRHDRRQSLRTEEAAGQARLVRDDDHGPPTLFETGHGFRRARDRNIFVRRLDVIAPVVIEYSIPIQEDRRSRHHGTDDTGKWSAACAMLHISRRSSGATGTTPSLRTFALPAQFASTPTSDHAAPHATPSAAAAMT